MSNRAYLEQRQIPRHATHHARRNGAHAHHTPKPGARQAVTRSRFNHYISKPLDTLIPLLFTAAVIAALVIGYQYKDDANSHPAAIGTPLYWLGIAGGSMMLVLLLYPLRKRVRFLKFLGSAPGWFRWHMILGVIGPTLIIFHSNFSIQSFNASVATIAMVIVVASGVIGRYFYAKIHRGLYGTRTQVQEIRNDAETLKAALGEDLPGVTRFMEELTEFEARVMAPRSGFGSSLWMFLTIGFRQDRLYSRLMRITKDVIKAEARRRGVPWRVQRQRIRLVKQHLKLYFATVAKAARFGVYERLMAAWHILHLPLFFLLIAATALHILGVHLY
jgi:hypothetical protein